MVNKRRLLINVCNKRYAAAIFRLLCSCRCDCGRALNLVPRGENQVKIPHAGMCKINTPFGANKKYVWDILNYLRHISNYVGHIFCPVKTALKHTQKMRTKYGHAPRCAAPNGATPGNHPCRGAINRASNMTYKNAAKTVAKKRHAKRACCAM